MISSQIITLPARLVARGVGFARGTLGEARRLLRGAAAPPHPGPVNVHAELGLDPAPPERRRTPRPTAVTGIDQQAEPRLVESTPADVADRLERSERAT